MNAQKELEKLERRAVELQREQENLSVLLASARTAFNTYEAEAGEVFYQAERTGDTKAADQAEVKLARLSLEVARKERIMNECASKLAEVKARIGEAQAPPLRERLGAVMAEAEKIARKGALTSEDWRQLFDLWSEGNWLISEIMRLTGKEGETGPFADPRLAFARCAYGMSEALGWGILYLERARQIPSAPSPYAALFGEEREYLHSEVTAKSSRSKLSTLIGGIGA